MQGPDAVGTEGIKGILAKLPLGDGLRGDGKAENLSLAEGIGFLDGEDKGIGGLGDTKGVIAIIFIFYFFSIIEIVKFFIRYIFSC